MKAKDLNSYLPNVHRLPTFQLEIIDAAQLSLSGSCLHAVLIFICGRVLRTAHGPSVVCLLSLHSHLARGPIRSCLGQALGILVCGTLPLL